MLNIEKKKELAILLVEEMYSLTTCNTLDKDKIKELMNIWKEHTQEQISDEQVYKYIRASVAHLYKEDKLASFRKANEN